MAAREDKFRDKLRQDGRMTEFKARVAELREAGQTRGESWLKAALEFGYEPEQQEDAQESVALAQLAQEAAQRAAEAFAEAEPDPSLESSRLPRELKFALDSLYLVPDPQDPRTWQIGPEQAPSPSAWSLTLMAAANQPQFMRLVANQLMVKQLEREEAEKKHAAETDPEVLDPGLEDLRRKLRERSGRETPHDKNSTGSAR